MVEDLPQEAFEEMATKKNSKQAQSFSLISDQKFQQMHSAMVTLRSHAKRKAASRGAEAPIVGSLIDLRTTDIVIAPAQLLPEALLPAQRLRLLPSRSARATDAGALVIAPSSPSSVLPFAAGSALGRHTAANDSVIVAFSTPDAAHRAGWVDALRLAGKHKLPIIMVLLPGDEKEAALIGSEAMAAGVFSIPVDSADVVAIYRVAFESLARARRRTGATLIVSTEYRLENEKSTRTDDPISKMKRYLKNKGIAIDPR